MRLAQLNIAKVKFPLDHPQMSDFTNNLPRINALAESSDGFIWRLKDELDNATSFQLFDDPDIIINLSVWRDPDALKHFMMRTAHVDFLKRKSEWFNKMDKSNYVMWWIEDDHLPTLDEAKSKLYYLHQHGDSPAAFTFRQVFEAE